jgi:hypothetical protein
MRARPWILALLSFFLLFGASSAEAAKKKKNKQTEVQTIGVSSMDVVFRKARKLDSRISTAERSRRTGKANFRTSLGLTKKGSLQQALNVFEDRARGQAQVALSGGKPELNLKQGFPQDLQLSADALDNALISYTEALDNTLKAPVEAARLVKKAKAFPSEIKGELLSNPLKAVAVLKNLKTTKNNIAIMSSLPKRSRDLTKALTADINIVVQALK